MFSFLRTSTMFSLVGVLIYIPAISVGGFTSLQTFCRIYLGFFIQPFLSMWGDAPLYIWFAFLWELVMLSVFSCALWPSLWHLWRNVHLDHWLIFNWIFFYIELCKLFLCVGHKLFVGIFLCKNFFPFWGLSFSFTDGFLCCADAFNVY